MKNIILLGLFVYSGCLMAGNSKTPPHLECRLDKRTIEIDLSQKIITNDGATYKVDFFLDKANFGSCSFNIDSELSAEGKASPKNQTFISLRSCKFLSEEQSKDLIIAEKGFISYSIKEHGTLDILQKRKPLTCAFKKL